MKILLRQFAFLCVNAANSYFIMRYLMCVRVREIIYSWTSFEQTNEKKNWELNRHRDHVSVFKARDQPKTISNNSNMTTANNSTTNAKTFNRFVRFESVREDNWCEHFGTNHDKQSNGFFLLLIRLWSKLVFHAAHVSLALSLYSGVAVCRFNQKFDANREICGAVTIFPVYVLFVWAQKPLRLKSSEKLKRAHNAKLRFHPHTQTETHSQSHVAMAKLNRYNMAFGEIEIEIEIDMAWTNGAQSKRSLSPT